ncbi:LD-carboxypeptidase [Sphingomicrobium astaxanthinifaciens]|uniref:LD-carboxypeptidase n=1 Tax=Sphingomicrobium astaxanthinifaciens TaxID=1227949 RepID=UPI001FCB94AF|nr:LD-carboxypeptidase [Sphingomicrobium astaxanthinifaciens]MCJ7421882.1 LD-carboxypeptidase [Sphingomicrobium astaxanthinifaciens]
MRIGVVAPSCPVSEAVVEQARARAEAAGAELVVHPQVFASEGHFAGSDAVRCEALLEMLGDERIDWIWCARGGYGSNRIAAEVADRLPARALGKKVMGYSDAGFLLSALHKAGLEVAHGPIPADAAREGGEAALDRALAWMVRGDTTALEPDLAADRPSYAFNLEVLVSMLGTPIAPDLGGAELLIEEVAEYQYASDRALFALTRQPVRPASLRMGRFCAVPENDRPFGEAAEAMVRRWCEDSGIAYRGRAAIGHDADNRIVPFGTRER